jgi:hypothetical protein
MHPWHRLCIDQGTGGLGNAPQAWIQSLLRNCWPNFSSCRVRRHGIAYFGGNCGRPFVALVVAAHQSSISAFTFIEQRIVEQFIAAQRSLDPIESFNSYLLRPETIEPACRFV